MSNFVPDYGKFSWKGHGAMLLANTSWGLMSPLAKVVMAGGVVTPFVLTDLRIFGAMVLFWAVSLFQNRSTCRRATCCVCLPRRFLP